MMLHCTESVRKALGYYVHHSGYIVMYNRAALKSELFGVKFASVTKEKLSNEVRGAKTRHHDMLSEGANHLIISESLNSPTTPLYIRVLEPLTAEK